MPISFRIFQFIVIHIVKGFGIVDKAEIDVFLELSCYFDDPVDVGNLISGSSAFSKTNLNIWKLMVHILLKPSLENFEHYFASMWDEYNCVVVWAFFGIACLWDWVSCRQHIYVFSSCIHSASLCLLVGAFNPLTLKVIIDICSYCYFLNCLGLIL